MCKHYDHLMLTNEAWHVIDGSDKELASGNTNACPPTWAAGRHLFVLAEFAAVLKVASPHTVAVYEKHNAFHSVTPDEQAARLLEAVTLKQAVKGRTGADTIAARESVYGPFSVHAEAEQDILEAVQKQPGWAKLNKVQKSAMQMIVHKMARILNDSADYDDNWHDIAGYATLAEKDIENRKSTKPGLAEKQI